jgi:hypothetical protein
MSIPFVGIGLVTLAAWPIGPGIVLLWWLLLSWTVFFWLGWKRLRKENAVRPLTSDDPDRFRRTLGGTTWIAALWFAVTIGTTVAFVIWNSL